MHSLSLNTRFNLLSCAMLFAICILAYTGYNAVEGLLKLKQLDVVNATVRSQMELDMMHDALNGDVQGAISAINNKNAAAIDGLTANVADHIATSEKNLASLAELDLPSDLHQAIEEVTPRFRDYAQKAQAIVTLAKDDIAHGTGNAQAAVEDFHTTFEALEEELGKGGDMVIAWSTRIKEEGDATAKSEKNHLLMVLGISIALALFVPIYARLTMFRAMDKLVASAHSLANEEYDIQVPYSTRHDEIGKLAHALDVLRGKAAAAYQLRLMVDDMPINIMTADLNDEFKISYMNKATTKTLRAIEHLLPTKVDGMEGQSIDIFHKNPTRIRELLRNPANLPHQAKINLGSEVLNLQVSAVTNKKGEYIFPMLSWAVVTQNVKLANDFETSVGAVSQQLGDSATMLQERAASLHSAIEELSVAAQEISRRVHDSLQIVRNAVETGNTATSLTDQLSNSAEKISNVVTLIRSIAEKTNLLALNATIESARAGDAGKGFAVVANEVKALASQTGNAIIDVSKQITEMQAAAKETSTAIAQMSEIVQSVNAISTTIASTVEEQQAATAEIARNISGSTNHENPNVRASTIMGMAEQLIEVSGHLQNQCEGFLAKVRAI